MDQMDEVQFEEIMQRPYRAWIEHYRATMEPAQMEKELAESIAGLPDPVYEGMAGFMDAALKLFVGTPGRWEIPGVEAAAMMAVLADEKIPAVARFAGDELDTLYGTIFDVVTLFFAAHSAESPELRRIMGLAEL